ncbi:MAG: hypothetical protein AABO58_16500 [Acidobacteriota bacterium]
MAEMLKRQYDLVVLKVTLDTTSEEPQVRFEIEVKIGDEVQSVAQWQFAAGALGVPDRIDRRRALHRGYDFQIPPDLLEGLKHWLEQESTADTPLWLHLVKPYGYLCMVPWERLLQPILGVPLLRLPDFIVHAPRETPRALDVLLCSSGPLAKEQFRISEHLVMLAQRLSKAVPRRTRFHIFADAAISGELHKSFQNAGMTEEVVTVYGPESAAPYAIPEATTRVADKISGLENPWLLWMRDSLHGSSVDVAHFVCHGYLSHDRGALAFAESPLKNSDTRMSRFVGAAELKTFLTQIGAWATVFSSPEFNYSQMGLRQLADSIAQSRPGPVVHHDLEMDPEAATLGEAYRLLFSRKPERPPASPAVFIYCQPFRVLAPSEDGVRAISEPQMVEPSELDSVYDTADNVPAWIAASERYVEERELRLRKLRREPGRETPNAMRQRTSETLESTLKEIRAVVARIAATTRSGSGQ